MSVCLHTRDRLIEQLTREIQALKEELESFRLEVNTGEEASEGLFQTASTKQAFFCDLPPEWTPLSSPEGARQ